MKVERYYSSIREEVSPLASSAYKLLDKQDYVGFFMACGSNYVRSIRRAQEVTAVFMFTSSSQEMAQEFAAGLRSSSFEGDGETKTTSSTTSKTKFAAIQDSLEIKILGFGLGLNQEGAGTLVANSLAEYNQVMKFAFRAMTQSAGGSNDIGMVYGIEVVPWVDNVQFQVASKLHDENIEVPLPRSLIPRAYHINGETRRFDNSDADRADFICKEPAYEKDKYGYCCELQSMYKAENQTYNVVNPAGSICRPLRSLDKSIVKNNMATNGEFVARLDSTVRYKLNQFSTMEKCVSQLRQISDRFDYFLLQAQATAKYDADVEGSITLKTMKLLLDPFGDYSMVKHVGKELDEFMDMYYQPCLAALFGSNIGTSPGTEASYFMANAWHTHPECTKLSCLSTGMRWNRGEGGGCVPSLLSGATAAGYSDQIDGGCTYDTDSNDAVEKCKYPPDEMNNFTSRVSTCWNAIEMNSRVDYLMDVFCMPVLSGTQLLGNDREILENGAENSCNSTNVVGY